MPRHGAARAAVRAMVDEMAFVLQGSGDEPGDARVVLDQQHVHPYFLPACAAELKPALRTWRNSNVAAIGAPRRAASRVAVEAGPSHPGPASRSSRGSSSTG